MGQSQINKINKLKIRFVKAHNKKLLGLDH